MLCDAADWVPTWLQKVPRQLLEIEPCLLARFVQWLVVIPAFFGTMTLVSHWMDPQELFLKYPKVPEAPEAPAIPGTASPTPLTLAIPSPMHQRPSCSAPVRLHALANPEE